MDYEDFESAGLTWEELQAIHDNYRGLERKLRGIGKDFVDEYLYDIEKAGIHSYRYRTKEPGHLIEKIIRKRNEHPEKFEKINSTNYCKYVTDLIGIRVFFLYREDWKHFHEYITSVFENNPEQYVEDREADFDGNEEHYYIAERPKVYRRTGDSRIYDESLIDIKSDGIYRSLHYIVKYKGYYVEIQARTLFEEGWSEVDHDIVYPYFQDDEMLKDFSTLLNRLSGMADEFLFPPDEGEKSGSKGERGADADLIYDSEPPKHAERSLPLFRRLLLETVSPARSVQDIVNGGQ